ncbi:hypothetical protein CEXT_98651 [Caerostris extrusa]|uniref:Uncharacterized protein n=1 Tax=Caerostris extrusa TaxID=172846 RepID=A0AAV4XGF8_CAEEX|nr:hypothetical protein CEXT_98651 [Caerostris extrusa]
MIERSDEYPLQCFQGQPVEPVEAEVDGGERPLAALERLAVDVGQLVLHHPQGGEMRVGAIKIVAHLEGVVVQYLHPRFEEGELEDVVQGEGGHLGEGDADAADVAVGVGARAQWVEGTGFATHRHAQGQRHCYSS